MQRALRSHQQLLAGVVEAIATGQTELRDILAAVRACCRSSPPPG
jgi:hypothetical protein